MPKRFGTPLFCFRTLRRIARRRPLRGLPGDGGGICSDNTFRDCGYNGATSGATIALNPSNTIVSPKALVHENVVITGNRFVIGGDRPVVYAKSTGNLLFTDNEVEGTPTPIFILNGCSNVGISGNTMPAPEVKQTDCLKVKVRK